MSITVDFSARTLSAIYERGLQILRDRVGAYAYNDAIETGVAPGVIYVLAWFHEQNAHYYDRRRRNGLLYLADTLESMKILTRAQGFRMRPATAAGVSVLAEPSPAQPAPITLSSGTKIQAGELLFELVDDAIIPASKIAWPDGTTDDIIVFTEGATKEETFISTGEEWQSFSLSYPGTIEGSVSVTILGEVWEEVESLAFVEGTQSGRDHFTGDGSDSQEFVLSLLNVIVDMDDDDALTILVLPFGRPQSEVQVWQQVADFTGGPREYVTFQDIEGVTRIRFGTAAAAAAPGDGDNIQVLYLISGAQKRYQLVFDEYDTGQIMFADGTFGVIPVASADIVVRYRVGGGVQGNVPPGTIDQVVQGVLPSGARTSVRITNIERGSGGEPAMTLEEGRFYAPRFAKSNNRAVRKEDWVVHAATYIDPVFGAPSHANAFLKQKRPELNTVQVPVWGRDELGRISIPGTALKVGIKRYLDTRRTFATTVEVVDGQVLYMDITVSILLVQGATRQSVFSGVTAAIQRFFDSADVRPGVDLPIGGLFQAIEGVDGVDRANIESIIGSRLASLTIGTGDGNEKEFSGDFVLDDGMSLVGQSVTVTDGSQQVVDDGEGAFTGDDIDTSVDPGTSGNTIDYASGKFTVTFDAPPPLNAVIEAEGKIEVFFATTESLPASDGSSLLVDTASTYYPIVQRGPRGVWSGDQTLVVDGARVSGSNQFRGSLPTGIIASSLSFVDSSAVPQVVGEDGIGNLKQPPGGTLVGSVNLSTGVYSFVFQNPPVLPVRAVWNTNTVDIFVPEEYLPLEPGRLFFWGGYSDDGAQPGGAELFAFDDGDGNIVGDVAQTGSVIYETGHVVFEWNATPPPGISGGSAYDVHLTQAPDGSTTEFDYTVRDKGGGAGSPVDISSAGGDGVGRSRFLLNVFSAQAFAVDDAFDNWQGLIHGDSLNSEEANTIDYANGTGELTFEQPLPAGVAATGSITAVVAGSLIDGETVTIGDGFNTPVVFEFDKVPDGVTPGNVVVDVSGATTADDVRDALVAAINGQSANLAVTAAPGTGTGVLDLTHNSTGAVGNVTITDTVIDVGFSVSGMSGGSGTAQDFIIQVTNVATFMYSAFVLRAKTATGPGLDKGLFADNNGRLWGDSALAYPTNRLDHLRGRIKALLTAPPIQQGRIAELSYDAFTSAPPVRDIPVDSDQVAVAGRISLFEVAPEVEADA